jgi:hypothetical protein
MAAGCHPGPVTPSDDLSPPRRPIFFPVVIATVFLTIIGMTVGFLLGERHRDQLRAAQKTTTTGVVTPDPGSSSAPPGPLCPPETLALAAKLNFPDSLYQILKITTENGTTVWICQDDAGSLYYQSKTRGVDSKLVQGDNGLFLSQVTRRGDKEYEAFADDGARFLVSTKKLEIHFADPGKKSQVYDVETVD